MRIIKREREEGGKRDRGRGYDLEEREDLMSNGEKRRDAFMYHDGSILTVVNFNPSHATKERRKDRESLIALLVLTIEFRREERRKRLYL